MHDLLAMLQGWFAAAAPWLVTYLVHSTVLLAGAWLLTRFATRLSAHAKETIWRTALFGAFVTASLQIGLDLDPVGGRIDMEITRAPAPLDAAPLEHGGFITPVVEHEVVEVERFEPGVPSEIASAHVAHTTRPKNEDRAAVAWPLVFGTLWFAVAACLVLRIRRARRSLRARIARREPLRTGPLQTLVTRLRATAGLRRHVALSTTTALESPVALGLRRPEICVPTRAVAGLTADQQEAMIAHEMGHIVRADSFWLFAEHLVCALCFFQPLNRLAARKLRETAELLCDDWAVDRTGRPIALAECLTEVAGWMVARRRPVVVPSMAQSESMLGRRVRRLVRSDVAVSRRSARGALFAAAVVLMTVAGAAPSFSAIAQPGAQPGEPSSPTPAHADTLEGALELLGGEIEAADAEVTKLVELIATLGDDAALTAALERVRKRAQSMRERYTALKGAK